MISSTSKTNPPAVCDTSGGFCSILCKAAYTFRLLLPVVSAQPFANVIANYTCCDGNKKCNDDVLIEWLNEGAKELQKKIKTAGI